MPKAQIAVPLPLKLRVLHGDLVIELALGIIHHNQPQVIVVEFMQKLFNSLQNQFVGFFVHRLGGCVSAEFSFIDNDAENPHVVLFQLRKEEVRERSFIRRFQIMDERAVALVARILAQAKSGGFDFAVGKRRNRNLLLSIKPAPEPVFQRGEFVVERRPSALVETDGSEDVEVVFGVRTSVASRSDRGGVAVSGFVKVKEIHLSD